MCRKYVSVFGCQLCYIIYLDSTWFHSTRFVIIIYKYINVSHYVTMYVCNFVL